MTGLKILTDLGDFSDIMGKETQKIQHERRPQK